MVYLVKHPNIDTIAEVTAPDSRHARTVFLDHLSRNNIIPWEQRQAVRKQLWVKRTEPGTSQYDIQLRYRQSPEIQEQYIGAPEVEASPVIDDTEYETPLGDTVMQRPRVSEPPSIRRDTQFGEGEPVSTDKLKRASIENPDIFGHMNIVKVSRATAGKLGKRIRPI